MTDRTSHASDEDLVLLFYGELPDEERTAVAAHVDQCDVCRAESRAIARTLHLVGASRGADPGPDFADRTWTRLRPQLAGRGWSARYLVGFGAWAATVAAIAGGTWLWAGQQAHVDTPLGPAPIAAATEREVQERVLLSAVDAHLAQTEMLFVELLNAPVDSPGALDYVRVTADDLVSSGRLYRETARTTGDAPVAAVLDDLEAVLVEVARGPDEPRAQDIRALQGRIEEDDLLFKVRAVALDVKNRQDRMTSGEGAL